jgi:hypothetical protein
LELGGEGTICAPGGVGGKAQMADTEAIALLDTLEPWIRRQRERLIA